MQRIKAKPSNYKGIMMRSLLEVRWAKFLDYCKIEWVYEPEAYIFKDGTMYLPDFYLPQQQAYFEVKGIMYDSDMHKIKCLAEESERPVIIGYENGKFEIYEKHLSFVDELPTHFSASGTTLFLCSECKKYWFANLYGGWECKCCGAYDGDHHIDKFIDGNENTLWNEVF